MLSSVKYIQFHVPGKLVNWFFNEWESPYREAYSFDSGGGGFGSEQLLRDWQLDFMPIAERRGLLKLLAADFKRRGWTTAQMGNTLQVYIRR
jgi:hypothetical protein